MNPLADLIVVVRCWYWAHLVAAIERTEKVTHPDYRWARAKLSMAQREMRRRGMA